MSVLFKSYRILNSTGNVFTPIENSKYSYWRFLKNFHRVKNVEFFFKVSFSHYRWNTSVTKLHGSYKLFMQSSGCLSYDIRFFFLICIIDMSALIVTMLYVNIQQSLLKQYDTSLNLNEIKQ